MLVPLSWLKDYVPLPADPAALVERLTIAGLESSGVKKCSGCRYPQRCA